MGLVHPIQNVYTVLERDPQRQPRTLRSWVQRERIAEAGGSVGLEEEMEEVVTVVEARGVEEMVVAAVMAVAVKAAETEVVARVQRPAEL